MTIKDLANPQIPIKERIAYMDYIMLQSAKELDDLYYDIFRYKRDKLFKLRQNKNKELDKVKAELKQIEDEYYATGL